MIEISCFPEFVKENNIMSVPAILIDDANIQFGAKKMEEIIELIQSSIH